MIHVDACAQYRVPYLRRHPLVAGSIFEICGNAGKLMITRNITALRKLLYNLAANLDLIEPLQRRRSGLCGGC